MVQEQLDDIGVIGDPEIATMGLQGFWKARPVTEGDARWIYCEASNESLDSDAEQIVKAALLDSRDLFLTKGNFDIDHLTLIGHRMGIKSPRDYEIGRPTEIKELGRSVWVKGRIYTGWEQADRFWKSLTEIDPPMDWYPSVGGIPREKRKVCTAAGCRTIITKAQWVNLAFARQPVNLSVPAVSAQPFGAFAKSIAWLGANTQSDCHGGTGCSCGGLAKGVDAGGMSTDVAALTGGAALGRQSLQGGVVDRTGAQARLLRALGSTRCEHTGRTRPISHHDILDHFTRCEGMSPADASAAAGEFLGAVRTRLRSGAARRAA